MLNKIIGAAVLATMLLSCADIQTVQHSKRCAAFEREYLAEAERAERMGEYELDASEYAAFVGYGADCAGEL